MSEISWGDTKVYVAGHRGLVGSALVRALESAGVGEIVGWTSSELDLRDRDATIDAINQAKPDIVIDAAARVGGIMANSTYPVDFLKDNMLIQTNVMQLMKPTSSAFFSWAPVVFIHVTQHSQFENQV